MGNTRWAFLLVLAILHNPVFAREPKTSNAPFLTPTEAVAKMDIPDGFDVTIFAAEPDIEEPIAFCFDDRGRMWVVENINYVNRRTHKSGRYQPYQDFGGYQWRRGL